MKLFDFNKDLSTYNELMKYKLMEWIENNINYIVNLIYLFKFLNFKLK